MDFLPLPQQKVMINHILRNPEAALFVDMGLGKTAATLFSIATLIADFEIKGALIIAPLRVALLTWPAEVQKYEEFKWMRIADLRTPKGLQMWHFGAAHLYIINYDMLQHFCTTEYGLNRRGELPVDMVVWDELSKAKNHASKRIKAFLPHRTRFKRHLGLTGTPIPNSYLELQPQMRLIDGGKSLGANFMEFRRHYFDSDYMGYNWTLKPHAKRNIEKRIAPTVLTLRAEEYLDIPKTEVRDVDVSFPRPLLLRYRTFQRELLMEIGDQEIVAITAAALVNKLLQFTSGALYDEEKLVANLHDLKIKALKKIADDVNRPLLVAYHYKHERERLLAAFPYARDFSESLLPRWNKGEVPMMIGHPASIGHGLNLQEGGRDIIWFTLTYSRELYDQFNARLVRTGQKYETTIWRLIVPRTVDDAIAEALREKGEAQSGLKKALNNVRIFNRDAKTYHNPAQLKHLKPSAIDWLPSQPED